MKTYVNLKTRIQMLIALLSMSPKPKTTQMFIHRGAERQIHVERETTRCVCTTDYYPTVKRNRVLMHSTMQMNLKNKTPDTETTFYIISLL